MIFDFPVYLNLFLPILQFILGGIILLSIIIILIEKKLNKTFVPILFKIKKEYLVYLFIINFLSQLILFPCADLGANCWKNCFLQNTIGNIGFFNNIYLIIILCILFIYCIFNYRYNFIFVMAYGISAFIQLGFFNKGLWCIVRSSAYHYLWTSFKLLLFIQFMIYFITLIIFYLVLIKKQE